LLILDKFYVVIAVLMNPSLLGVHATSNSKYVFISKTRNASEKLLTISDIVCLKSSVYVTSPELVRRYKSTHLRTILR